MKKAVTLQMIAERAGVSTVTVSNVLSGKKGAGSDVRSKILALAEEMGYQYKSSSKQDSGQFYQIGIIIAERYVAEYPSFYMNLYRQIAREISRRGGLTILEVVGESREKMEERFFAFENVPIQGIMIVGEMNPEFVECLQTQGEVPVVCVDFYDIDKNMNYIVTDSYRGTQLLTQHLISCGHRDIAFLGTPEATKSIMDRYMGYCKAMFLNHIEDIRQIDDRNKCLYSSVIEFELPEKMPSAFVCNCERTAALLVEKLEARGLRVPEDVSVAAFDRSQGTVDGLEFTRYESDEKAMAQISISTLIKQIEGSTKNNGIRMVEGEIKLGNTVKEWRGNNGGNGTSEGYCRSIGN